MADVPDLMGKVQLLQAAIKYEQDDLMNTKAFIEGCPPEEAETSINHACVMYKEALQPGAEPAMFEKARLRFQEAMNQTGFQVSRGEGHRRGGGTGAVWVDGHTARRSACLCHLWRRQPARGGVVVVVPLCSVQ